MLSAICLNLDRSKSLSSGNGLIRKQKFRFVQRNSLQNVKILALTKLKAITDDKFIVADMMVSVLDREANVMERGHYFLLFPNCFQKLSVQVIKKLSIIWKVLL